MTLQGKLFTLNEEFHEVKNTSLEEYSRQFHLGLYQFSNKVDELLDICQEYMKLSEELKEEIQESEYPMTEYMFITINPFPDTTLMHLHKSVRAFLRLKPVQGYIYVTEQRGTNDDEVGKGFHIHMIIRQNWLKKSHFKRDISRVFKDVCNIKHYACLNISCIKDNIDLLRRMNYILGQKENQPGNPKQTKQKYDLIFRKKIKEDNYNQNNFKEELLSYQDNKKTV